MGVFLTNNIIQYLNPIKENRWKLFPLCNHNCTQDKAINYADLSFPVNVFLSPVTHTCVSNVWIPVPYRLLL